MASGQQPTPFLSAIKSSLTDQSGQLTWIGQKLFTDWNTRLEAGLNLIGQFIGNIADTAHIGSRPEGIGTTVGNIDHTGVMQAAGMAAATSAAQGSVYMPLGAISNHLGGAATRAVADFDAAGSAATAQANAESFATGAAATAQSNAESFASNAGNIASGTLSPTVIPAPTSGTLGGVKSVTPVGSKWVTSIDSSGNPVLAQPSFTDISGQITTAQLPSSGLSTTITTAKLTGGGANGSMTFTNGILTASTPST